MAAKSGWGVAKVVALENVPVCFRSVLLGFGADRLPKRNVRREVQESARCSVAATYRLPRGSGIDEACENHRSKRLSQSTSICSCSKTNEQRDLP
jgi:hypothetical protein